MIQGIISHEFNKHSRPGWSFMQARHIDVAIVLEAEYHCRYQPFTFFDCEYTHVVTYTIARPHIFLPIFFGVVGVRQYTSPITRRYTSLITAQNDIDEIKDKQNKLQQATVSLFNI